MRRTEGTAAAAVTQGRVQLTNPLRFPPRLSRQARVGWALLILAAIAAAAIADVGAQDSINLGSIDYALESQTFVGNGLEGLVAVRQKAIVLSSNGPAKGTSPLGVEARANLPPAQTALVSNNYEFTFEMKEVAASSWQSGDNFRIDVSGNGTLLGTVYSKQGVIDDNVIEGVTVHIDSGSTDKYLYAWSIVISRQ